MVNKTISKEGMLYPFFQTWLINKDYYTGQSHLKDDKDADYLDTGVKEARIDVLGIKNIHFDKKTFVDEVELLGIEVKLNQMSFKDFSQTAGYRIFCHRVYLALASSGEPYTDRHIEWAKHLGIGLLFVELKNNKLKHNADDEIDVNLVLEAPYQVINACCVGDFHLDLVRSLVRKCKL